MWERSWDNPDLLWDGGRCPCRNEMSFKIWDSVIPWGVQSRPQGSGTLPEESLIQFPFLSSADQLEHKTLPLLFQFLPGAAELSRSTESIEISARSLAQLPLERTIPSELPQSRHDSPSGSCPSEEQLKVAVPALVALVQRLPCSCCSRSRQGWGLLRLCRAPAPSTQPREGNSLPCRAAVGCALQQPVANPAGRALLIPSCTSSPPAHPLPFNRRELL